MKLVCWIRGHRWTEQWAHWPGSDGPGGFNWWLCRRCGKKVLEL